MDTTARSLFIGVMGAPFESELVTTLLRIVDAGLAQGLEITVWTCGGATALTHNGLGAVKPRNIVDLAGGPGPVDYPTTLTLIRGLLTRGPGQLTWCVCRHCMEERGVADQMTGVKIQAPFKFPKLLESATSSILLGVK